MQYRRRFESYVILRLEYRRIISEIQAIWSTYTRNSQLKQDPNCGFRSSGMWSRVNLLNPTAYVMHQQFNIQQLYVLPTLYLCVLYLSESKQRLVPLTA